MEAFLRVVVPSMARHRPVIGIGSMWQLTQQGKALGLPVPSIQPLSEFTLPSEPGIYWLDPWPTLSAKSATQLSEAERGEIARRSLEIIPRNIPSPVAVLTAPVNKANLAKVHFKFPGQTEFFESHWQSDAVMMLAGPKLRVALATNHLSLANVPTSVTKELIERKLRVMSQSCGRLFGKSSPKIAVCALNPHAGDNGLFGHEDQQIIKPAVESSVRDGLNVEGPFPADTVFYRAYHGEFDAVLAMYHDQGLGPLKTVHFDSAVNVSLGLPHLRVSPDHGPAADLFLTGRASMNSFDTAAAMCERWLKATRGVS